MLNNKYRSITHLIYRKVIDPLLSSSHSAAASFIKSGDITLDVACGDGTLAFMIGKIGKTTIGIDLDHEMINSANERAKRGLNHNVKFIEMNAVDLADFKDGEFDSSTVSMALHQFSPEEGLRVLKEMKRVSETIIIVDYNYPMPRGIYKLLTYGIERVAGGDHFRNFKKYMGRGGVDTLLLEAGLKASQIHIRGKGILRISKVDKEGFNRLSV